MFLKYFNCFFLITNALGIGNIDKISEFCREKDILFLEDNCRSLGSKVKENFLKLWFSINFSFVGHHLSTIEGGMICTDDEELASSLIMSRAHGWDRQLNDKKSQALGQELNISDFILNILFMIWLLTYVQRR